MLSYFSCCKRKRKERETKEKKRRNKRDKSNASFVIYRAHGTKWKRKGEKMSQSTNEYSSHFSHFTYFGWFVYVWAYIISVQNKWGHNCGIPLVWRKFHWFAPKKFYENKISLFYYYLFALKKNKKLLKENKIMYSSLLLCFIDIHSTIIKGRSRSSNCQYSITVFMREVVGCFLMKLTSHITKPRSCRSLLTDPWLNWFL